MEIIVKARRTEVQERFRTHVSAKLAKVEKLDRKAIRVDVEVTQERNPRLSDQRERVQLTITSRGPVVRAEAAADDRYAAFDRALSKLETRLRRSAERRKDRRVHVWDQADHKTAGTVAGPMTDAPAAGGASGAGRVVAAGATDGGGTAGGGGTAAGERAPSGDGTVIPIQMEGEGPVVVREKAHPARPISVEQALFEMELVGHDFYLFRDEMSGSPSVVYRRHGYQYGLIRLVEGASGSPEAAVGGQAGRRSGRA